MLPADLASLRDIHLPIPVAWWPLAPGWYGLMVLGGGALLTMLVKFVRSHRNTRARRQALHLLATYRAQYEQQTLDASSSAAAVSQVLKRVALAYFPRARVAGLQGEAWIHFLNETSHHMAFERVRVELLDIPYQQVARHDLQGLFEMAMRWIRQRRGPCLS